MAADPSGATPHPVTLLVGFDAMCGLLEVRWIEGGKQSEDLAVLLGSVSREAWANGQPLDIAQWSFWLEAVLSIRPDLDDVRQVQLQLSREHRAFLKARDVEPLEARRKALDRLRSRSAGQTWHRIGHRLVVALDAYRATGAFLTAYWRRGGRASRDIATVVDELRFGEANPPAAQWEAWLAATRAAELQTERL